MIATDAEKCRQEAEECLGEAEKAINLSGSRPSHAERTEPVNRPKLDRLRGGNAAGSYVYAGSKRDGQERPLPDPDNPEDADAGVYRPDLHDLPSPDKERYAPQDQGAR
jgi:hypothetical protein